MSIRSTAKALLVNDGKLLLNRCNDKKNGDYYSLPGGGQQQYETLHDALIRECLEETGYRVKPLRLAAVSEEICTNEKFRAKYSQYAHKVFHVFYCELVNDIEEIPTETDTDQEESVWIPLNELSALRILPKVLGDSMREVLNGTAPLFLGSELIALSHG